MAIKGYQDKQSNLINPLLGQTMTPTAAADYRSLLAAMQNNGLMKMPTPIPTFNPTFPPTTYKGMTVFNENLQRHDVVVRRVANGYILAFINGAGEAVDVRVATDLADVSEVLAATLCEKKLAGETTP